MKRYGNLWDKIVTKENLILAFEKARRHKRWQKKVKVVEENLEYYINELHESLINGTYKTSSYRLKKIYEPKERDIYILPFYPDRILHHAIMNILEPTNVPIGNYLSQWFGNLYLNELDVYMKQDNHVKNYIRYCDDFLLFSNDKVLLKELAKKIEEFVTVKLKLKLSKCDLFPTSQGVDFLGYRHFPKGYILVRKTTVKRMKRRLRKLKWEIKTGRLAKDRAISVIGSLMGWLRWANTYNLKIKLQLEELRLIIGGQS